ncbi:RHS repeat-associated core domain-containing protein [Pseudomonas sp. SWRI111]|uniref:RHS repeat domain-containing protein n=1 Tax=Pseudomonas sp. SWRI111 TaxID=2745507 RepID=UPI0032084715
MNTRRDTTTPTLSVIDPRALAIRSVAYCRHPDKPDIDARITRQVFDNAGRQVASWDPRLWGVAPKPNLTTSYALSGQALFTDSVDAGWQVRLLNEAGSVCSDWDARGSQSHRQYDDLQRPLALTEQAHEGQSCVVERWTYGSATDDCAQHNQCGRPIRHDDPAGNRHFNDYGLGGAVLVESRRFLIELETPDWPIEPDRRDDYLEKTTYVTRQTFNPTGELQHHTDAMGNISTQHYNVAGQSCATWLLQAGDGRQPKCLASAIRYNAQGQIESETAGNGVIARAEYSRDDGRLLRLLASVGARPALQDLNYVYDPVGNIISLEDKTQAVSYFNNQRIDPVSWYRYDSLYQLVEASGWEVSKPSHGPALPDLLPTPLDPNQRRNYTQKFDYDAAGNLITRHHSGAPGFSMFTSAYSNRSLAQRDDGSLPGEPQIGEGFDQAGNQLELQRGQAMSWDVRNQLRRVTMVQRQKEPDDDECYAYDRSGHRLRKTYSSQASGQVLRSEVRYLPGLEVHHETDGKERHVISVDAGRNQVRMLHWPADAEGDQLRYSLCDHLGSSNLELDDEARVLSQEYYYPFGGSACWAGKSALVATYKTIHYSAKERDATGLYYYGYRYYAPWLQRWTNTDPGGSIDGLNQYRFVSNNPLTRLDVLGAVGEIPADVEHAYGRMFKQGLVWEGLGRSNESGVDTINRLSTKNILVLEDEIESELQRNFADRFFNVPLSEYSITHFSKADFTTEEGVYFKTLVTLQNERGDVDYEGNSMGGNIPNYGNHDFSFFALEAGKIPGKTKSRFGDFRYSASLEKLGEKSDYAHMEVGDLMRPNNRDASSERLKSLPWMADLLTQEYGVENFLQRVGLRPDTEADLLFYGADMLKGLGLKIAVDLSSLSPDTQDAVVEWTAGDRPLENLSQVINIFYRPQIAVPGGLKIKQGDFLLQTPGPRRS